MNLQYVPPQELTTEQQRLSNLWDEHLTTEFATKDASSAVATMTEDAQVNHVPVLTGGVGRGELLAFYSRHFIPQMPADTQTFPVTRTVGSDRLVDEMIARFTHDIAMDWMLPGLAPTGKYVEIALVIIVQFREGKMFSERIYWDQASVLVQLGVLDDGILPVAGAATAHKVLDPSVASNELLKRVAKQ